MSLKFKSVFDIIGPIMVGPSSSHTAGAAKIGLFARQLFAKNPTEVIITLYGSFAKTYKGHGTDVALIGGLMNFEADDERIPNAKQYAQKQGMKITFIESDEKPNHPNTVKLQLTDGLEELDVTGISIGGGKMQITEIDNFPVTVPDRNPSVFIVHEKSQQAMVTIRHLLSEGCHKITDIQMSQKDSQPLVGCLIELDQPITCQTEAQLRSLPQIKTIKLIKEGGAYFHSVELS